MQLIIISFINQEYCYKMESDSTPYLRLALNEELVRDLNKQSICHQHFLSFQNLLLLLQPPPPQCENTIIYFETLLDYFERTRDIFTINGNLVQKFREYRTREEGLTRGNIYHPVILLWHFEKSCKFVCEKGRSRGPVESDPYESYYTTLIWLQLLKGTLHSVPLSTQAYQWAMAK